MYMFYSDGVGRFPGVIDLFGTRGGLLEYRASLLASHGFCTLALAYFDYDDLPKDFSTIDLTYFEVLYGCLHFFVWNVYEYHFTIGVYTYILK